MEQNELQIFQTLGVIVILLVISFIIRKIISRISRRLSFAIERKNIIIKTVNLLILLLAIIAITGIWSVDPKELYIFLTSILTIIGVAFFAQWSILSNVTASLILYFNHPLRVGGPIKIMDNDYPIEGHIENISLFFLYIRTNEGDVVTVPTSIAMTRIININYNSGKKSDGEKYED